MRSEYCVKLLANIYINGYIANIHIIGLLNAQCIKDFQFARRKKLTQHCNNRDGIHGILYSCSEFLCSFRTRPFV